MRILTLAAVPLLAAAPLFAANTWRGPQGDGRFPAAGIVTSADEASNKNIVWKLPLPFIGCNSPVYAAERIFVLCDAGWKSDAPQLLCVDVNTGKLMWQQPVDNLDARPAEEAQWARAERAKEYKMARRAREILYQMRKAEGDAAEKKLLAEAKAEGFATKKKKGKVSLSLTSCKMVFTPPHARGQDYKRLSREGLFQWEGWYYAGIIFQGQTFPSVVSDGVHVYATTNNCAVACFDMAGNRKWIVDVRMPGHKFHGSGPITTASPTLVDDRLVLFRFNSCVALNKKTGQELWRHKPEFTGAYQAGSAAVHFKLEGTDYLYLTSSEILRLQDGKVVGKLAHPADVAGEERSHGKYFGGHCQSIARGDMIYVAHSGYGGGAGNARPGVFAYRVRQNGGEVTGELVWKNEGGGGDNFCIGADGDHIYKFGGKESLILNAADGSVVRKGKRVSHRSPSFAITDRYLITLTHSRQHKWKPDPNYRGTGTLHFYDKTTLAGAGEARLLMDESTEEVTAKRVARTSKPWWGWGRSSPTAWGNRVFVRSHDALYCIGNPSQPFSPPPPLAKASNLTASTGAKPAVKGSRSADASASQTGRPSDETVSKWEPALMALLTRHIAAGRRPQFMLSSMRKRVRVTGVTDNGEIRLNAPGLNLAYTCDRLSLPEKAAIAGQVADPSQPKQAAVAAFFYLAAGEERQGSTWLHSAGQYGDVVRKSLKQ